MATIYKPDRSLEEMMRLWLFRRIVRRLRITPDKNDYFSEDWQI